MKYIGIDYGTKKTGIAVSDVMGTLAFPREVFITNKLLPKVIADLIKEESVGTVVIGESRSLSGGLNAVASKASQFATELSELIDDDIKINFEDERFSTKQARALPSEGKARGDVANCRGRTPANKSKSADAQAAAIILQSFLDKQQNLG